MINQRPTATYLGLAILVFAGLFAALVFSRTSSSGANAADEKEALTEVLRQAQLVQFHSLVNDDASNFTTVFYNDPAYPTQNEEWLQLIEKVGNDAISSAIAAGDAGPVGTGNGFLSAKMAEHILIWENIRAWEAIEAKAAAEGREPSAEDLATMPNGETPYPRKLEADWVDVPYYVFDVLVEDDHATAKLAYIDPEDVTKDDWITDYGDVYNIFWFTRVDGQWYISSQDTVLCPCAEQPPIQP